MKSCEIPNLNSSSYKSSYRWPNLFIRSKPVQVNITPLRKIVRNPAIAENESRDEEVITSSGYLVLLHDNVFNF